jgi:hypothetical protein
MWRVYVSLSGGEIIMSSDITKNTAEESNQESTDASVKKSTWKSSYTELIFIILGVFLVFLAWSYYPEYISWRDNHQSEETTQFIIPYQIDAMLKTEPESVEAVEEGKTKFQQVGDLYGTYGDSYGSLNTLFSGLAFTFLVASLYLQRKELKAQRIELEEQRKEIKESNKIAEAQRLITEQQANLIRDQITEAQKQNFYSLFFQFLGEKNIKFYNLKIRSRNPREFPDILGDVYTLRFSHSFLSALSQSLIPSPPIANDVLPTEQQAVKMRLQAAYSTTCKNNNTSFEEFFYFEYFVFILDFISQNASIHNTDIVIDTFLSRLTFDETVCMACYAILRNKELKDYIERYSLLKNIGPQLLENGYMASLNLMYSQNAFTQEEQIEVDLVIA